MACNKWPCETGCTCDRAHPGYPDSGPHWRVCNACTAIANCERLICTTASNHQCNRCNFDRGGQVKAYQQVSSGGYPNRVCERFTEGGIIRVRSVPIHVVAGKSSWPSCWTVGHLGTPPVGRLQEVWEHVQAFDLTSGRGPTEKAGR
uniref:Uncharacterized protein n=1 Tax=Branchiostoma floridae TaxID=7739 RepID=C3YT99_BRAFL|eukprot:XP_002600454.1 hypothetical protein BRAFLDRAFT_70172 [Branchiostoma floridae]